MDEQTFRVLEFDKILRMAAAFAVTAPGGELVQKTRPLTNAAEIRRRIDLISECRRFVSGGRSFGIEHFDDLSPLFQRIRPADSVISPFELRSFLPLFYSALNLKLLSNDPECPGTGAIISGLTTHPDIKKAIENSIDREGQISDGASPELSHIRLGIRSCEKKIKGALDGILKQKDLQQHLQDFFLAERNNRWVIPVKIDSKGSVPGIVHDISNTGETVYMEPYAIQQLGNELESHRAEEKLEEYRVLRRLCSLLRGRLPEIEADYRIVAEIDALQAVAGFSDQMDMSAPEINEKGHIHIINGRHPLLWKTLQKENRIRDLVPLDLELGRGHSCMVITGSNAGGKTVALKSIGVLCLMALSGMHTPADSGTTFPFLLRVFADIGDDQSIEHNLSTFSAHIKRISDIVRQSGRDTMIIIDELGTGTSPEEGGALSCAILRKIRLLGAMSEVSTHLGMLKAFAHSEEGMINSAMEMEQVTVNGITAYKPTYKLVVGEPGTSHAFEIAGSLGLPEDIIKEARDFITDEDAAVSSLISELKQKTGELDSRLKETEKEKNEIGLVRLNMEKELARLKTVEKETLSKALREAEELLRKTRREAREIVDALKRASLAETREIVKELDKKIDEAVTTRKQYAPERAGLREVKEGQHVFVNALGKIGVVRTVNEKAGRCQVLVEGKEIVMPFTGLSGPSPDFDVKQSPDEIRTGERPRAGKSEVIYFPPELNVIGQRVDPALSNIERYLNDASMAGAGQVKIIHGLGTGILARAIREFLKDHPLVESFRKGNEDEGGEAVTIAVL
ncbi:MAG: Smr/MutS family protein [Nitrospirae bacterium]|nr:Smr/MutS family protein [Nitrospirota bacterium]